MKAFRFLGKVAPFFDEIAPWTACVIQHALTAWPRRGEGEALSIDPPCMFMRLRMSRFKYFDACIDQIRNQLVDFQYFASLLKNGP